ncbi:unnamed protein product [Adineta steineri]|uniref:Terpene synthase n=1 Tax=Adineta steineri TaxID=433720 RepID=A0A815TYN2_9BILA|nr:unnamed protein product [Adineta steineri]CAF1646611.1 unnamed protein product [Adineta steineri]
MTTSDANIIILPDVISSCSLELECNPYYEVISKETDAWPSSHGISRDESETKFNFLEALVYPYACRSRLRDLCDLCTTAFIYGYILDSSSKDDISEQAKQQMFYNIWDSFQQGGSFKPLITFASVIHGWWQRILVNARPTFQQRFKTTFRDAIEASLRQETYKNDHQIIPDLKTYNELRDDSMYELIGCTLIQYSLGFDLPDECLANETLKCIMECMMDSGSWANTIKIKDIYSFNNESSKDQYNLISVLMNANPSPSIQQAMDQAGQMVIDVYAHFERLRSQLLSWGADIDAQIEKICGWHGQIITRKSSMEFRNTKIFWI